MDTARGASSRDDARIVVEALHHQLTGLTEAARAIAGAASLDDLLRVVTEAAVSLVGTHQGVTTRLTRGWEAASTYVTLSDKYAEYRDYDEVPKGLGVLNVVTRENRSLRLTAEELRAHPEYRGLRDAPGHPPLPDYLAAPLISRDGTNIGLIQLADKVDGTPFDEADEAVLVQLAHMASAALEHVELVGRLEQTLTRLSMAFDATGSGTWDWDGATGAVSWSPTLERIYGYEPGTFPGTFEAYVAAVHPDDRDAVVARISRARETGERFTYTYRIVRPDGEVRWIEGAGMSVFDVNGDYTGMTGMCLDVTERRLAEERERRRQRVVETLHRVGQAITSRLRLDEIVQLVTDEATELTPAAYGAFFYNEVDANGESLLLYTISGAELADFEGFPNPRATEIFAPTFNGGPTVVSDDVTADPRFGRNAPYHGMPPGHLPVRSYLATPVVLSSGEVVGGLFFGHPDPGRFSEDDVWLVEGIASYAAIAIDNARLYEQSARTAAVLQASLLPPHLPRIDGVDLAARYDPGTTSVGGDFYDVFPLANDEWGVLIGDMCGQGTEAASLTALARHTGRTAAVLEDDSTAVLELLNQALLDHGDPDRFCTALYGKLCDGGDGMVLELVAAGHPAPLVRRADGSTSFVEASGTLLGVLEDATFVTTEVRLRPGDLVVLYTDGVIEARAPDGEQFGEDRLVQVVAAGGGAEQVASAIQQAVLDFRDTRRADDLAMLVIACR